MSGGPPPAQIVTGLEARWPRSAPPPLVSALLRAAPEDFRVEEQMPFALEGRGEHLWVQLRKRGWNSEQAAKHLARVAGVTRREVGYAGMKDRHAVTVQWFSLQLTGRPDPDWHDLPEGLEVLAAARHTRKLRTGALSGNCFVLTLRDCVGEAATVRARIELIGAHGVPNYFGEQRFGHDGENLVHARAMFAGSERIRERHQRGIYLSAARSFLFNEVLAERVRANRWHTPLAGEAFVLAGSNSFFVADEPDDTIRRRLAELDIHPSGPLWGAGEPPTRAAVLALESEIGARHPDLVTGLAAADLRQERRALRVIPQQLTAEQPDETSWRLRFCLPSGCYATAVLRELAAYRTAA